MRHRNAKKLWDGDRYFPKVKQCLKEPKDFIGNKVMSTEMLCNIGTAIAP